MEESASKRPRLDPEQQKELKEEVDQRLNSTTTLIVKYKDDVPIQEQQQQIMEIIRNYARTNNMNMTTIIVPPTNTVPQNEQEREN
jgi:hypothetical protein